MTYYANAYNSLEIEREIDNILDHAGYEKELADVKLERGELMYKVTIEVMQCQT